MLPKRRGFTLLELLVVVAVIALLVAVLLPSLLRARRRARSVVCLSNLRSIAVAMVEYAHDDPQENATPLHGAMIQGDTDGWLGRVPAFHAWGGGAASEEFLTPQGGVMLDESWSLEYPQAGWGFGARQRPLTRYLVPNAANSTSNADVFACPDDTGYPRLDQFLPIPPEHVGRPLFPTLGNSYSINAFQIPAGTQRFSYSVFAQRLGDLTEPSRQAWGGDALLGVMVVDSLEIPGWHGERRSDNVLYADGSARHTRLVRMGDPKWFALGQFLEPPVEVPPAIVRGPGYKLDCYPTPGVAINGFPVPSDAWGWPWVNARSVGEH